jgi:gas vesicle protein
MSKSNRKKEIEHEETNNPGVFLAGLLIGGLIGGLAGAGAMLLLAPQSGKKTRTKIKRKGRKLGKQTTKTIDAGVDQVRAKAHDVTSSIQEQVEDLQQRGQDVVDGQKERWAPVVKAGKKAVNEA